MANFDYRTRITIDPAKRGGKPCIRGLRITVYDVLDYLSSGMTEDQILADFPDLSETTSAPPFFSPPIASACYRLVFERLQAPIGRKPFPSPRFLP